MLRRAKYASTAVFRWRSARTWRLSRNPTSNTTPRMCLSYRRSISSFFFSSRRRHTRSTRDWSSDVCSSDLYPGSPALARAFLRPQDRLLACELEPHAASALMRNFARDRRVKVVAIDGWTALNRSEERRGGKEGGASGCAQEVKKHKGGKDNS